MRCGVLNCYVKDVSGQVVTEEIKEEASSEEHTPAVDRLRVSVRWIHCTRAAGARSKLQRLVVTVGRQ